MRGAGGDRCRERPAPVTFTDPQWLAEERRCLSAIKRGDRAAFQRLYQAMAPPLYARILLPRLGDPTAAEEALADTFARAVERLDSYQDRGGSIWSWLVAIAANRALDLHRERARTGRAMAGFQALLGPILGDAEAPHDEALDQAKLRDAVAAALARINPRYRRALELRFFEEQDRDRCAAALEVKIGTFDVLLLRALRAFRAAWLDSAPPELGVPARDVATELAGRRKRMNSKDQPDADLDAEPSAEERAEAEALARALQAAAPPSAPPPEDALAAAALASGAARPRTRWPQRRCCGTRGARKIPAKRRGPARASPPRRRARWPRSTSAARDARRWLLPALLVPATAAAALIVTVMPATQIVIWAPSRARRSNR